MQPQLPLVHQFLDKVSNEQHPGHHQHQWKDIRDGLQVPGEYKRSHCHCCCEKNTQSLSTMADEEAYHEVVCLIGGWQPCKNTPHANKSVFILFFSSHI